MRAIGGSHQVLKVEIGEIKTEFFRSAARKLLTFACSSDMEELKKRNRMQSVSTTIDFPTSEPKQNYLHIYTAFAEDAISKALSHVESAKLFDFDKNNGSTTKVQCHSQ